MKKHGEGPHNWGGPDSELADELAAQEDAQRDAEEAIAEGDEHPGVQSFTERATTGVTAGSDNQGSLSDEFAEKEGALLERTNVDTGHMDLKEIARSSGAVSHPTGDAVSSGAQSSLESSVDAIARSKGTEGGFGGNLGAGEQEIIRDASTGSTA